MKVLVLLYCWHLVKYGQDGLSYHMYHRAELLINPGLYEPFSEPFIALLAMVLSGDLCSGEYSSGDPDEKDLSSASA